MTGLLATNGVLRKSLDAEIRGRQPGHHALAPKGVLHAFRHFRVRPVVAVEWHADVQEELRTIGLHARAQLVEHRDGQARRISRGLQHQRWDSADHHGLGDAAGAVAADVARHLAAAGRMADMDRVPQAQSLDQRGKVVRIGVEGVALPWPAGPAVTATVVGDATKAVRGQEEHLVFESVGAERPAMAEDHGLPRAPVVVVDLRSVFRRERAHALGASSALP
jgi:hypothetical protein